MQWQIIKKLIPQQKKGPKQICRRRIINAVFYLVRTGYQWRNLPHRFAGLGVIDVWLDIATGVASGGGEGVCDLTEHGIFDAIEKELRSQTIDIKDVPASLYAV